MKRKRTMRMKIATVTFILLAAPCLCRAQQGTQASSESQQTQAPQQNPPQQGAQSVQQSATSQAPLLRVDGDIMAAKLVHAVTPVYPQIAELAHVSGTVVLHVIVAADGTVRQITYISGPPLLRQAAMRAVEQWRFEPTLLNGTPVEVDTVLPIHFDCCSPRFTSKLVTRDDGSSRAMLTESVEIVGAGKKQNWTSFLAAFEDATSRAWLAVISSASTDKKGKVTVEFDMRRDGSIGGASLVTHSSHDPAIDEATGIVMRKCAPFHGVPADFPDATVHFRVTFAYDHPHALAAGTGGAQ